MKIVAIVGPAGSGKSMISDYLAHKYGATRYSFAEPLKEIVRLAFNMTWEQVYGSQAQKEAIDPRYNVSPRWLLQHLGTEGIREVLGPNFWWQHCQDRILYEQPSLAVIDDMRFANEAEGLLALNEDGTQLVHIWRIESDRPRDTTADQNHQSESEWMLCRHTDVVEIKCKDWTNDDQSAVALYEAVDLVADRCGLTPTYAVLP